MVLKTVLFSLLLYATAQTEAPSSGTDSNAIQDSFESDSRTKDVVDTTEATGNEAALTSASVRSTDQCPSVSDLGVREERHENQTMLILNWSPGDDLKVTNVCVTVTESDMKSDCLATHRCDLTPDSTEQTIATPCPDNLLIITIYFVCDKDGGLPEEIQYKTKPGEPSAVRSLSADAVNATSITVRWQEPERANGPLDGFTMSCLEVGSLDDNNSEVDVPSFSNSWSVFDLQSWTDYKIRISAFNYFDNVTKLYSTIKEIIVRTLPSESDPPTDVKITSITENSFVVQWKEPIHPNGVILGYRVSWFSEKLSNLIIFGNVSASETSLQVKGVITPFTEYVVMVATITNAGIGKTSDPVSLTTESSRPSTPDKLAAENVTNSTIDLSWDPPTNANGIILQYTLDVRSSSYELVRNLTNTTYELFNLEPYTQYEIRVKAWTVAGDGNWSTITKQTDVGVPGVPKKFVLKEATPFLLSLSWSSPVEKNGPIDGYCLTFANTRNWSLNTTTRKMVMSDLKPWTAYQLKLSAFNLNNAGVKLMSDAASLFTRTLEYPPGVVNSITVLDMSTRSFSIRWNSPIKSNGLISEYIVRVSNFTLHQIQSLTTTNTEVLVEELDPFTSYYFSVSAQNGAGEGDRSETIAITTDVGVPGRPENLKVRNATATHLFLVWEEPRNKAGPINGYVLSWNPAKGSDHTPTVIQVLQAAYNFTGLKPWSQYVFQVRAYNQNKKMEPLIGDSTDISVRTPVAIPLPPSITSVAPQSSRSVWIEWKNQGDYPGPDAYVVEVWKINVCQSSYDHEVLIRNHTHDAISWKASSTVVRDLEPFIHYSFRVIISTDAGTAESDMSLTIATEPDAPSEPRNFNANCSFSSTSVSLSWDSPEKRNGIIIEYQISYRNENSSAKILRYDLLPVWKCEKTSHHLTISGFQPETTYSFAIKAKTNGTQKFGPESSQREICILPAGVPPIPDNSTQPEIAVTSERDVTVKWSKKMFSTKMGRILYYSVIVASPNIIGQPRNGSMQEADPLPVWAEFYNKDTDIYQATPQNWNPFQGNGYDPMNCRSQLEMGEEMMQCIVGWEKNCSLDVLSYCNGPLKPGMVYGMKLRGFTNAGFAESYPIFVKTDKADNSIVLGLSVGLVLACVVLFSVAAVVVVMKRKKKTGMGFVFSFRKSIGGNESTLAMSPLSSAKPSEIPRKSPYDFLSFLDHIKLMMSDSGLKFSLEYETLKQASPRHPCAIAEMEENRCKNRWTNILPFDHSRVKLLPIDDEPGSDYINASYIPGFFSHREYIASQGPLPSTVDDFWRMIWEQKVSVIVMLTQCVERGKAKCEQYWPKQEKEDAQYGDLKIRQISEIAVSAYAIRTFSVTLGARECIVKHMHYILWPDFGCPESPQELMNFVRAVREVVANSNTGPVLVHCSAGVGRTGTFIAVDRLLQHVRFHPDVDIYNTVLDMRQHRTNMVQTEDQYIYIHKCLRDVLVKRINYEFDDCNGNDDTYSNAISQDMV